ncbi:hypothetical protein VTO73DRAFT_2455 [Trametes versicolor]
MSSLTALVLVSVLQFSALLGGVDASRPRQTSPSDDCLGFSPSGPEGVVLAERTYYPANTTVKITNEYLGFSSSTLPAFCRLQLLITTNATAGSFTHTEIWLPDADAWNERLLTIGGGGLSGGEDVLALGTRAIPQGFAGVSTNGGHNSSAFDGSWAGPHNDNAVVDYAWRSIHLSVLTAKDLVQQYYKQAPVRSYFQGCSNGGRQGLKETQLFPDSFDGMVVGSPANWFSRLVSWGAHLSQLVEPATSSRFIPEATWKNVIAPEVMKQCDALDGVTDNVINDPTVCNFNPETLACTSDQDTPTCLNADQLAVLPQIYADYYENGEFVSTGFNLGGEDAYFTNFLAETPSPLVTEWLEYMVLNDTTWTLDQYNSSVYKIADAVDPGTTNAMDPNMSTYAAAPYNGKVLHYVGLTDEIISPRNSMYYYNTVREQASSVGLNVDDYYRLFPGGHGANSFGGATQQTVAFDAEHDVLAALMRWVEDGVAPERIVATKFNNDTLTDGVAFTRPLCKYPATAKYIGGAEDDAASFECA